MSAFSLYGLSDLVGGLKAVARAIEKNAEALILAAKINANAQAYASGNRPRYQSDGSVKRSDRYRDDL